MKANETSPIIVPGGSVSRTLEFVYDWWCIANFAERIGHAKTEGGELVFEMADAPCDFVPSKSFRDAEHGDAER